MDNFIFSWDLDSNNGTTATEATNGSSLSTKPTTKLKQKLQITPKESLPPHMKIDL